MISKLEALTCDMFHDSVCRKWRRNGQTQTWKRDTTRFRVPVKFGLYRYDQITQDNAYLAHVPGSDECTFPNGR
jgi:hypothetical protein